MRHELVDAASVFEAMMLAIFALVVERDDDAGVQEGEFAQALRQRVEAVFGGLEHLRIRLEADLRAAALGGAGDDEIGERTPALVALRVDLIVAPDLDRERFGERVDDGD